MTYSDFDLSKVQHTLGLSIKQETLFSGVESLPIPQWLQEALDKGIQLGLSSEKARSEFIVAPILLTVRDLTNRNFHIHSGQRLDVDPALGLIGECDFIIAHSPPLPVLKAPIVTIVEAKKNDIE